jgi:RNA polymerase sigma-70 factor (ECF subfamily)
VDAGGRAALQQDLTALSRGDRAAFDRVFDRLWPLLRGFARRFLPAAEAEDAAQEVLIRIFSRASEFDSRRDALSWALGIAAWQIRTQRTRMRRRREDGLDAAPERVAEGASPEAAAAARDLEAAVARTLAELSPDDEATLRSYARGERPHVPGPTFRKRVSRALERLRDRWRITHGSL